MAPAVFKDLSKSADDLLNNDYCFDRKIKLTSVTANGLSMTTEGTLKAKGVSGKLTGKFSPFPNIEMKKIGVDTNGRFFTEAVLSNAIAGAKFTVKAEDGGDSAPSGDLTIDYSAGPLSVSTNVDVTDVNGPTLYGSATYHHDGKFLVGGEVRYNTGFDSSSGSPAVVDYNAALGFTGSDFTCVVSTKKKASDVSASFHHNYSKSVQLATTYGHGARSLSVGGIYTFDDSTKFQGKLNSSGIVSANAIQTIRPGVKLISSVEVDAKNLASDSHKFGLQLILG